MDVVTHLAGHAVLIIPAATIGVVATIDNVSRAAGADLPVMNQTHQSFCRPNKSEYLIWIKNLVLNMCAFLFSMNSK